MRAFFITLVLLAAIGGGGYYYWREHPEAFATNSEAEAPPPEPNPAPQAQQARAESCAVQNARYESRGNRDLKFRFAATPENFSASGPGASAYDAPAILLTVTAGERTLRFAAASATGATMAYLFPAAEEASVAIPAGAAELQLSTFDSQLNYLAGLPRPDSAAPAHIFAPNLSKYLAERGGEPRIEAPISMIDFVYCDEARAPAVRPPAPQM